MNKDKKILYTISLIAFAVLLGIFLLTAMNSKIVTAVAMAVIAPIVCIFIRKRCSLSTNKKEVLLLNTVIAALYVITLLIAGTFVTSYKNPYFVSLDRILTQIIPIAVIIIASELVRFVLICQKSKLSSAVSWLICVFAEVLMFSGVAEFNNFNHFMDLVGMTLFPAITSNILYHYVSKRYGMLPNMSYRLICALYIYFIPTYSKIPDALHACIKILLPLALLALIRVLFEKKKRNAVVKGKKISLVGVVIAAAVIVSTAMLISCQFRYGALVIATESMTGEINKGDMIIYEEYRKQEIKEGQVIVFLDDDNRVVHRVANIVVVGNEARYFTKGDANEDLDAGYRTEKDIVGLTDIKVSYVGYPTLWLREQLQAIN